MKKLERSYSCDLSFSATIRGMKMMTIFKHWASSVVFIKYTRCDTLNNIHMYSLLTSVFISQDINIIDFYFQILSVA